MEDADIDFAASLDHRETDHIENNTWVDNPDKFIYGTELSTTIEDIVVGRQGFKRVGLGLHYNMLFANKSDFVDKVLLNQNALSGEIKRKLGYEPGNTDGNDEYQASYKVNGEEIITYGHIKQPSWETDEFKQLIQTVLDANGFFVLAHPMLNVSAIDTEITVENANQRLLPYMVNGMGLEVMYKGLGTANVKNGYKLWQTVLKNNYRVYATAGTDSHDKMSTTLEESGKTVSLTSIYVDGKVQEGTYVNYLKSGNFTAGSVGIQMCVGKTMMGQSCSFQDVNLEIGIGALHESVFNESHKYRVDVWSDTGIVYSQSFNATTREDKMTYLKTKANPNCRYYRVEVFDVTSNTLIALGNPIWNSAFDNQAQ